MEQTTRKLKIYSTIYPKPFGGLPGSSAPETRVPLIKLQGVWLRELGFEEGDRVIIVVEKEKLVITLDK
jgi:Toxin SymE, type I toxin-antitoxin system